MTRHIDISNVKAIRTQALELLDSTRRDLATQAAVDALHCADCGAKLVYADSECVVCRDERRFSTPYEVQPAIYCVDCSIELAFSASRCEQCQEQLQHECALEDLAESAEEVLE